jgi:Protein of unknown function (DUF3800)
MSKRIIIYSDESSKKGPHFSNFYGASLVLSENVHSVEQRLKQQYAASGLTCEIKWNNMFTHNMYRPIGLTDDHIRQQYFLLYYQFIKHGLGLGHYRSANGFRDIQLICDQFPHTGAQVEEFRRFLVGLNQSSFQKNGLRLRPENIGEARSHDHIILQGTDLILGAIQFKLNGFDRAKPEGQVHRGKKTRAKERVYKHILKHIWKVYPNLNIGISTGDQGDFTNRWLHPYRHWKLIPKNHEYNENAIK